jgi:hypothetical protein
MKRSNALWLVGMVSMIFGISMVFELWFLQSSCDGPNCGSVAYTFWVIIGGVIPIAEGMTLSSMGVVGERSDVKLRGESMSGFLLAKVVATIVMAIISVGAIMFFVLVPPAGILA